MLPINLSYTRLEAHSSQSGINVVYRTLRIISFAITDLGEYLESCSGGTQALTYLTISVSRESGKEFFV